MTLNAFTPPEEWPCCVEIVGDEDTLKRIWGWINDYEMAGRPAGLRPGARWLPAWNYRSVAPYGDRRRQKWVFMFESDAMAVAFKLASPNFEDGVS